MNNNGSGNIINNNNNSSSSINGFSTTNGIKTERRRNRLTNNPNPPPCRIKGLSTITFLTISAAFYFLSQSLQLLLTMPISSSSSSTYNNNNYDVSSDNNNNNDNNNEDRPPLLLLESSSGYIEPTLKSSFYNTNSYGNGNNNNNNNNKRREMYERINDNIRTNISSTFEAYNNTLHAIKLRRRDLIKNKHKNKKARQQDTATTTPPLYPKMNNYNNNNNNNGSTTTTTTTKKRLGPKKLNQTSKYQLTVQKFKRDDQIISKKELYLQSINQTTQQQRDIELQRKQKPQRVTPRQLQCNDDFIINNYDMVRIPGYIEGCSNTTYFGYVMRDLTSRLFYYPSITTETETKSKTTSQIIQHNVLVVGSNMNTMISEVQQSQSASSSSSKGWSSLTYEEISELYKYNRYNVAKSFALQALQYKHNVIGIDNDVDTWWSTTAATTMTMEKEGESNNNNNNNTTIPSSNKKQQQNQQKKFLVALFDPDIGEEDLYIQKAAQFLQSSSAAQVKYVIYRVSSSKKTLNGLNATRILIDSGYTNIQILSSSHSNPVGGGNLTETYPPNTILKDGIASVYVYLKYGSKLAINVEGTKKGIFRSYLIAMKTSSLDLAIPFRREYIDVTGRVDDWVINLKDVPYKSCPTGSGGTVGWSGMKILFTTTTTQGDDGYDLPVFIHCNGKYVKESEMKTMIETDDLWFSNPNQYSQSEAMCVRCPPGPTKLGGPTTNVACTSRFPATITDGTATTTTTTTTTSIYHIESSSSAAYSQRPVASSSKKGASNGTTTTTQQQHLLVIHLEKMSRQRFQQLLPKTMKYLQQNFIQYNNYTSIDMNGPSTSFPSDTTGTDNFHALFGGGGGGGKYDKPSHRRQWLWDVLYQQGYRILKASNRCVRPSEYNQSSLFGFDPHFYGSEMNEMFCFDFDRPNCLGRMSTGNRLLSHGLKFIRHHYNNNIKSASILTFNDGHEDSGLLAGTLDEILYNYLFMELRPAHFPTLNIVVVSSEGMDYGPYFKSLSGYQESIQPIFYIRTASHHRGHDETLKKNSRMYTTPFDIYETILELASAANLTSSSSSYSVATKRELTDNKSAINNDVTPGLSLLKALPTSRRLCITTQEIPDEHCDLLVATEEVEKRFALEMPTPPSFLSFYADIPRYHRHHVITSVGPTLPERAEITDEGCWCASNYRRWFPCEPPTHPWGPLTKTRSTQGVETKEYFIIVDCPGKPTHFEINMVPHPVLMNETGQKLAHLEHPAYPNIVFLELDSTSLQHAERHFPKTRELLKRYRVKKDAASEDEGYSCPLGFCSADFSSRASLAGSSSIPNQVAALGGCLSTRFELCGLNYTADIGKTCNDTSNPYYGLRLERARANVLQSFWCTQRNTNKTFPKTPWLPAIADRFGYVNYFGEELCYEGSPYVTQGNVFPKFYQDIEPHKAFCRLGEKRMRDEGFELDDVFRWSLEDPMKPCIDGYECGMKKNRIALGLIESMFDTYHDRPKMAFLNSGASHIYTYDQAQQHVLAEYYDDDLSTFLEQMLKRPDAKTTIWVIRSDHGLQKGPMAMEYNLQVEHNRPWTEILVPESLPNLSKRAMAINQDRLTTSYDIYRTLREVMEYPLKEKELRYPTPPLPDWSQNLLSSEISLTRTCAEARVDTHLCREKTIHPSMGICNVLDAGQSYFCHDESPRGFEWANSTKRSVKFQKP